MNEENIIEIISLASNTHKVSKIQQGCEEDIAKEPNLNLQPPGPGPPHAPAHAIWLLEQQQHTRPLIDQQFG